MKKESSSEASCSTDFNGKSDFSLIPIKFEVSEFSLEVWKKLPQVIREDPSIKSFQMENGKVTGENAVSVICYKEGEF